MWPYILMSFSHQCDIDFLFLFYKYLLTAKDSAKKRQTDLHICKTLPYFTNIFIRKKTLVYQTFIMQDEPIVLGILSIITIYWEKKLVCHTGRKNTKCYASTIYMKTFACHSRILQVFYYPVEARIHFFFSFSTWKFVSFFQVNLGKQKLLGSFSLQFCSINIELQTWELCVFSWFLWFWILIADIPLWVTIMILQLFYGGGVGGVGLGWGSINLPVLGSILNVKCIFC